ncbi:hypothetical protein [Uliginosibacterium sediminicola]|uniref:Uncharacterized protein n=1 Tax=Uliginosibacterium sediminicola TaxID=2024550 RepID=A0ABU9YV62_9RHOO
MAPSFEIFDLGLHRRAFHSAADRERAGYVAELTGADFNPMRSQSNGETVGELLAERVFQFDMS